MLITLTSMTLAIEHGRHSRYKLVRGALDFSGVANRTASRSKYGGELACPVSIYMFSFSCALLNLLSLRSVGTDADLIPRRL